MFAYFWLYLPSFPFVTLHKFLFIDILIYIYFIYLLDILVLELESCSCMIGVLLDSHAMGGDVKYY